MVDYLNKYLIEMKDYLEERFPHEHREYNGGLVVLTEIETLMNNFKFIVDVEEQKVTQFIINNHEIEFFQNWDTENPITELRDYHRQFYREMRAGSIHRRQLWHGRHFNAEVFLKDGTYFYFETCGVTRERYLFDIVQGEPNNLLTDHVPEVLRNGRPFEVYSRQGNECYDMEEVGDDEYRFDFQDGDYVTWLMEPHHPPVVTGFHGSFPELDGVMMRRRRRNDTFSRIFEETYRRRRTDEMPNLTREEAKERFPVGIGVEMEYVCKHNVIYSWLTEYLKSKMENVSVVIGDGSLPGDRGIEVLSTVLPDIDTTRTFMEELVGNLNELKLHPKGNSPAAIHIHFSNLDNIPHIFYVMMAFEPVFSHLIGEHSNGLVHRYLSRISLDGLFNSLNEHFEMDNIDQIDNLYDLNFRYDNGIMEPFDPYIRAVGYACSNVFMNSRRVTLRWAEYDGGLPTLEFRTFPQRTFKKAYGVYLKTIQNIIGYAQSITIREAFDFMNECRELELPDLMKKFKEVTNLTNKELYIMFHKINEHTIGDYRKVMTLTFEQCCNLPEPTSFRGIELRGVPTNNESQTLGESINLTNNGINSFQTTLEELRETLGLDQFADTPVIVTTITNRPEYHAHEVELSDGRIIRLSDRWLEEQFGTVAIEMVSYPELHQVLQNHGYLE